MGGGGGAGGVVYTINQVLNGTYTIGVGKGGIGLQLLTAGQGSVGADQDGKDSFIKDSNGNYIECNMDGLSQPLRGIGGGGGGVYYNPAYVNGRNGGSGGGCTEYNPNFALNTPGSALQGNTYWNGSIYVAGGKSGRQNTTQYQDYNAGGGGGGGSNGIVYKDGNNGVSINITGTQQYYAAGGGAGQYSINYSTGEGIGGSGIGGNGRIWNGTTYLRDATSGLDGTGSGGGGGAYEQNPDNPAGSGGSGIVIIRYSMGTTTTITTTTAVQPYGYLKYDETLNDWKIDEIPSLLDVIRYDNLDSTSYSPTTTQTECGVILYKDPNIDLVKGKIWVDKPLKFTQPDPPTSLFSPYLPPFVSLDYNTSTLEIDSNGKLNVKNSTVDLTNYNNIINCSVLNSSGSITAAGEIIGSYITTNNTLSTPSFYAYGNSAAPRVRLNASGELGICKIELATPYQGSLNNKANIVLQAIGRGGWSRSDFVIGVGNDATNSAAYDPYDTFQQRMRIPYDSYTQFNGIFNTPTMSTFYWGYGTATINSNTSFWAVVTKHNGAIWTTNYIVATSDRDIKKDIEELNDDECLQKLLLLKPCKYRYIDETKNTTENKTYGYIAQEVAEVLPEAVKFQSEYIPNAMIMVDINDGIFTIGDNRSDTYTFTPNVGLKIKLYDEINNEIICEITEKIDDNNFRVDEIDSKHTKLFLYGHLKEDFNVLAKEYINAVHVSATQELHRIITQQQKEIDELKTKLNDILAYLEK